MRALAVALAAVLATACAQVDQAGEALGRRVVDRAAHPDGPLAVTVAVNGATQWRGVFVPPDRYELFSPVGASHLVIAGPDTWTLVAASGRWVRMRGTPSPLIQPLAAWPSLFPHPTLEHGPGTEAVVRASGSSYDAALFVDAAGGRPRQLTYVRKNNRARLTVQLDLADAPPNTRVNIPAPPG